MGRGAPLPHGAVIQRAFGRHDVSQIRSYHAQEAASKLGASAFAFGDAVVFGSEPSLFIAAHEAAHVVQQKAGRRPSGDLDTVDDELEQHADAVAAAVVAGRSAEAVLDRMPVGASVAGRAVQRKTTEKSVTATQFVEGTLGNLVVAPMQQQVTDHLETLGVFDKGPFHDVLGEKFKQQVLEELYRFHHLETIRISLAQWSGRAWRMVGAEKLAALVAPESLTAIVDRTRPLDFLVDKDGEITGKSEYGARNSAYARVVGLELANALARRYRESIQRVFPRFGRKFLECEAARKPPSPAAPRVVPESILPSHPLDLYLIDSLCLVQQHLDAKAISKYVHLEPSHELRAIKLQIAPPGSRGTLFHWVRSPDDATLEEVSGALFGKPEEAYRLIAMKPYWGFRARDVAAMASERRFELQVALVARSRQAPDLAFELNPKIPGLALERPPEIDPVAEMVGAIDERSALERAKLHGSDPLQEPAKVIGQLGDNVRNLEAIQPLVAAFHRSPVGLERALEKTRQRKSQLSAGCVADPDASAALAAQQGRALMKIATGIDRAVRIYQSQQATTRPSALEPTVEVIDVMLTALDAIELPELAMPRIVEGERLVADLPIRILETKAHESFRLSQGAVDSGSAGSVEAQSDLTRAKAEHQLIELAQQRLESDPVVRNRNVAALVGPVDKTWFDASVGARLESLAALWDQIDEMDDFWIKGHTEYIVGGTLKIQNRQYYERFRDQVWAPYQQAQKIHDAAAMAKAREQFALLVNDEGFKAHGQQVIRHLERAGRIKKWTKIIVAIGIAVIAFGLGQWQFAVLAPELGVLGASVVAGISTSAIQTGLEALVLGHKPTVGGFVVGVATNIATFAVIGRMMTAARGAAVEAEVAEALANAIAPSASSTAIAVVKQHVIQLAIAETLGIVTAQAAKLIDGGGALTEEELGEILVQQLIGAVGMHVGQLALDHSIAHLKNLRPAAERCGVDLAALEAEHDAIVKLGHDLGIKAKADPFGVPDRAAAVELTTRTKRYLEQLDDARTRLQEFAKLHPQEIGTRDLALLRTSESERAIRAQLDTTTALLGVEYRGPGNYRCDSAALPVVLEHQRAAGAKLERIEIDRAANERTLTFRTADNQELHLTETLAPKSDELPIPEQEVRAAAQRKALGALERGDAIASDRRFIAEEIGRQIPAGPLEISAIDHDAKTLIAIVTPGGGETGIKTLNDKLVGQTITNHLLSARNEVLRTVFAKHGIHVVANDYKTIKLVTATPPAEVAAKLTLALIEIDAALRIKLRHTLEEGYVEWTAKKLRADPTSSDHKAAHDRVVEIERALGEFKKRPDFTLGLQFGVTEIAGTTHAQLDLAARNASRAAYLARSEGRTATTEVGDPRGMIYSDAHYQDVVQQAEVLAGQLRSRTLPLVGARLQVFDAHGLPDQHLVWAVRKQKLKKTMLSGEDVKTFDLFEEFLPYTNTLDYLSPHTGSEMDVAAQQGHQATELIRALESGRKLTALEITQVKQILKGTWPQAGTASEAVFYSAIEHATNRVVYSADIIDLGVDGIQGGADGLRKIANGVGVDQVARSTSDQIVNMKRTIVRELRAFYQQELLPEARRRAAELHRVDLLAALIADRELLFVVGGDDITISTSHVFDELGLSPMIVRHLQDNARSRVAITKTGDVAGGRGHVKAAAEAEAGHDTLKTFETLGRYLGLVEKHLPLVEKARARHLARYFRELYTSSDVEGHLQVIKRDGVQASAQELANNQAEALALIKQGNPHDE